jgi:hypothetical protein
MVLPLWLVPAFIGPGRLVLGSIENDAADGKRLRAIDAFYRLKISYSNSTKAAQIPRLSGLDLT